MARFSSKPQPDLCVTNAITVRTVQTANSRYRHQKMSMIENMNDEHFQCLSNKAAAHLVGGTGATVCVCQISWHACSTCLTSFPSSVKLIRPLSGRESVLWLRRNNTICLAVVIVTSRSKCMGNIRPRGCTSSTCIQATWFEPGVGLIANKILQCYRAFRIIIIWVYGSTV